MSVQGVDTCGICNQSIDAKSEQIITLTCTHLFHQVCFNRVAERNFHCHSCRPEVTSDADEGGESALWWVAERVSAAVGYLLESWMEYSSIGGLLSAMERSPRRE